MISAMVLPLWTHSVADTAKAESLIYWTVFFDLIYRPCISPFRIKWSFEKKAWVFLTNKGQKIAVGILTVLYILNYIGTAIQLDFGSPTDPTFYFKVAEIIVASQYTALHFIGWTKQGSIQAIYSKIQARKSLSVGFPGKAYIGNKHPLTKETWVKLFCNLYMLQSVLALLHIFSSHDWDPVAFFEEFEELGTSVFFLPDDTPWFVSIPLGVTSLFLEVYSAYAEQALELFLLITILFFRSLVMEAIDEIQSVPFGAPATSYQAVLNTYRNLKELTYMINEVSGTVCLVIVFGGIVFMCQMIVGFTKAKPWFICIRDALFIISVVSQLYLAADTNRKAGAIYKWLYHKMNFQHFSQTELMTFLHDLSLNDLGIGVDHCFTITFSFIGVLLGLLLSYTLLYYQLQALSSNPTMTFY